MRKLICFDMDMTLYDHKTLTIPESALKAVGKLQADGHIVAVATGRDMDNEFSSHLAEIVKPDAIVHCNGQKVTVGGEVIREAFLEKELVERLLDFAEERGYSIGANLGPAGCFTHKERVIEREKRVFGIREREFLEPERLLEERLYALTFFGTPEEAAEVERAFPELKLPLFAAKEGADVIYRESSKALGIRALLEYYGLGWQDVVAFGDSMNDVEMLKEAGLGIAMGNAVPALKDAADFVTKRIDEDGVVYGLRYAGLLEEEI
ncbi:MAG: Cof-type HAD-IIB family hydrolase [Eubacteriales bacterium]|nr:Cof-type HAD-IIB family hydrolase [Eubacteriales bacterium]